MIRSDEIRQKRGAIVQIGRPKVTTRKGLYEP